MFLLLTCFFLAAQTTRCNETAAVRSFVSRPDILSPKLNVRTFEAEAVVPGCIFLSTWGHEEAQNAPYIFDPSGELVWSGYDASLPSMKYFNFQAHHLHNSTSLLSLFRGISDHGRGQGHIALLDSSYNTVQIIESPRHLPSLDFHEFRVLDDGQTVVVVAFQPIQADLRQYGVGTGLGWLLDSCFLRRDLQSGETLFEWCASKHISLHESNLEPSAHRAAALSYSNAFDYFHINSVDVFSNGDYLISARHTDTIYRLDANTGSVKWRLGGTNSSFAMPGLNFSAQHDAQVVSENGNNHARLHLFDNAFNGEESTAEVSSAMVIDLDLENMSASLAQQFFPTQGGLAQNQGSVQQLPRNHTLVSWGMIAEFTEFDQEGKVVLDVAFADIVTHTYRVRKGPWVGRPETQPDLYLYARNASANAHFWMSWNGATEVTTWRMFSSTTTLDARAREPVMLGSVHRTGFETRFAADRFVGAGFVEALDHDGQVLGRSTVRQVVLPSPELQDVCGDRHCTLQMLPASEEDVEEPEEPHVIEAKFGGGMAWSTSLLQWAAIFGLGVVVGRVNVLALSAPGRRG